MDITAKDFVEKSVLFPLRAFFDDFDEQDQGEILLALLGWVCKQCPTVLKNLKMLEVGQNDDDALRTYTNLRTRLLELGSLVHPDHEI